MGSIASIIADLKFGRSSLFESIEALSERELTAIPVYDDWTVKDVLAHIIGWDQHVIKILPMILQNRTDEIPGIDVEEYNQQTRVAWQDKSLAQVLAEIESTHQQIVDILTSVDHVDIDKRRERRGRTITIRSYVIDIMLEHERQHAVEIEQWRKTVDQAIDPEAVKTMLVQTRAKFMTVLDRFKEDDVLAPNAIGDWSINDVVGHIADWEQVILKGARHLNDPSRPAVTPVSDTIEEWNQIMAATRADKSWPENYQYLLRTHLAMDEFVATLKPDAWKLRGPYPWSEQGSLAELLTHAAEHYTDHLPDLEGWYKKRYDQPNA